MDAFGVYPVSTLGGGCFGERTGSAVATLANAAAANGSALARLGWGGPNSGIWGRIVFGNRQPSPVIATRHNRCYASKYSADTAARYGYSLHSPGSFIFDVVLRLR